MDDKGYPRFQFSVFDKNGHDGQWVVRGDEWEQFLMDKEAVMEEVNKNAEKHDPISHVTADVNTHPCKTCGNSTEFKSGTSKTGKDWKGYFCKANKDHVEWVR
jgi:hypothetical protein